MSYIALKRAASFRSQPIGGLGYAPIKALLAIKIVRILQLAAMDTQIPVCQFKKLLEFREREFGGDGQRANNRQASALMNQAVQT